MAAAAQACGADILATAAAALGISPSKAHVDEATGSDEAGDGSEQAPFKTVLGAFIARGSSDVQCLVRKPAEGESAAGWIPATSSSVKRSKKNYEGHLKKLAKASKATDDAAAKEDEGRAQLEASKKIVLEETPGSAKRIKIRQGVENRDVKIRVFGWVHRLRQQKGLTFLVLRDGTGYLQCVLSGKLVRLVSQTPPLLSDHSSLTASHPGANVRCDHPDVGVDSSAHREDHCLARGQDGSRRSRTPSRLVGCHRQGSR